MLIKLNKQINFSSKIKVESEKEFCREKLKEQERNKNNQVIYF